MLDIDAVKYKYLRGNGGGGLVNHDRDPMIDHAEEENEYGLATMGQVSPNLLMHTKSWIPVHYQISKGVFDLGEENRDPTRVLDQIHQLFIFLH